MTLRPALVKATTATWYAGGVSASPGQQKGGPALSQGVPGGACSRGVLPRRRGAAPACSSPCFVPTCLQRRVPAVHEGEVLRLVRPVGLVDAKGERRRGRLVHQAQYVQPRHVGGVQHRPSLLLREKAGHAEHAVRDLGSLVLLPNRLQLPQQRRQQLLRPERLRLAQVLHVHQGHALRAVLDLEAERGDVGSQLGIAVALANQPLQLADRVLRLHARLLAGGDANEALRGDRQQGASASEGGRGSNTFRTPHSSSAAHSRRRRRRRATCARPGSRVAPRLTCLLAKFTMDGVSRLDSLFSTTSMPLRRARPTTLVALPTSMPSTLMAVSLRGELATSCATRCKLAKIGGSGRKLPPLVLLSSRGPLAMP